MREETAVWLNPMLEEAGTRSVDTTSLLMQASMPAQEVDWTALGKFDPAVLAPDGEHHGIQHRGVDWIRFGQLLREEIGWSWYPEWPEAA